MILHSRLPLARRLGAAALLTALAIGGAIPVGRHVASAAGPTAANTLSIGWDPETKELDPATNGQNPDIWVMVNIYDQLLRVGPDGNKIEPDLATSWNISKDGKVYTFHLRPNVKFTNGAALTSADVKYSLDRAVKGQSWGYLLTAIKSVATPDPLTVTVTLKQPWGPFLADMSFFTCGVYPADYFKKVGSSGLSQHPIGSGPYMLQTWVKGQYLRLQKNPNYWDAASYPMQYIEFDYLPNDNTKLLKLQGGELDVDWNFPPSQIAALQGSQAAHVAKDVSTKTTYLLFQTQTKPLNDVNVRQAINHAIDRAALVKAVLVGNGSPANSFLPVGSLFYDPNLPVPAYNLTLAKQYMAKSSVPHGFNMTMEIPSGKAEDNQIAQIIQQEVAPLGIKLNILQVDSTTIFAAQQAGKYHSSISSWTNDIPDPDELVTFTVDYVHGGAYSFNTFYNDPSLAKLNSQAEQTNDNATRKKVYFQIQQQWANLGPMLPLFYIPYINGVSNKLKGFSENPLGYFNLRGVSKSS
jgi:peptide/nickel transport system substrate-binding protein